jgi:deoxyribonuclease-4
MDTPPDLTLLGAHVSTAGGLSTAFDRGEKLGCTAIQIFLKSPNRWQGRELANDEVEQFRARRAESPIGPVLAHAAYLLNLCAADEKTLERSRAGLADEMTRARRLELDGLVLHPGSHMGRGEDAGIDLIAASIDEVLGDLEEGPTRLLLEVTAGQGTGLGYRLEHLERIIERCSTADRLGLCLDTCHLFAAGYEVHTAKGLEALLSEVESRFGLDRLGCVHLNDSKRPLGSRRDRHANIGEGEIGEQAFNRLLGHDALAGVPLILETPLGDDKKGHERDLKRLRRASARAR